MTDSPYHFTASVPASEWDEAAQFGSKVKRGAHRLIRIVAATDDRPIGEAIAAAIVAFSQMPPAERADIYASIPGAE